MSPVIGRFGCRTVAMVGSVMGGLGYTSSYLSQTVEQMYLTFGLCAGITHRVFIELLPFRRWWLTCVRLSDLENRRCWLCLVCIRVDVCIRVCLSESVLVSLLSIVRRSAIAQFRKEARGIPLSHGYCVHLRWVNSKRKLPSKQRFGATGGNCFPLT